MKRVRHRIDAVLLLDKPQGPSSNDALQRARRAFSAMKAGHGGTLDPMATGLLPIAFGEATKFLHDLLDADKTYEATMRLGETTDTGDAEGVVCQTRPVACTDAEIAAACAAFRGDIAQVPPMHSALKRDGKPLYEYARAGIVLEREARAVTVHEIELIGVERSAEAGTTAGSNEGMTAGTTAGVRATFRARVSKGTYIRTLAQDIGERLGCGAHLVALRRTGVGTMSIDDAVPLELLEADAPEARSARLRPVDTLVSAMPRIGLADELADRFMQGQRLVLDTASREPLAHASAGPVRVYRGERLLGVAAFAPPGLLAPQRVLADLHE
jgi:tRNA pseudouridine55 synthase